MEKSKTHYSDKLNEFINISLSNEFTIKLNNFGSKHTIIAQAAKVSDDNNKQKEKVKDNKTNKNESEQNAEDNNKIMQILIKSFN